MKKFILKIGYEGLGDHLFCSHLPRIAKQFGHYDKVYISKHSPYRDFQTKEVVWGMNPFVDGFCDEDKVWIQVGNVKEGMNLLDKIMLTHGLDDGNRFHEPEIYYKPKIIPELKEATIFDPNFGTTIGHPSSSTIESYFKRHNISITYQMKLMNNHHPIKYGKELCSKGLLHFCDIIYSCKALYCFHTGTSVLAASLKIPATVFNTGAAQSRFEHSRIVNYITLGNE